MFFLVNDVLDDDGERDNGLFIYLVRPVTTVKQMGSLPRAGAIMVHENSSHTDMHWHDWDTKKDPLAPLQPSPLRLCHYPRVRI